MGKQQERRGRCFSRGGAGGGRMIFVLGGMIVCQTLFLLWGWGWRTCHDYGYETLAASSASILPASSQQSFSFLPQESLPSSSSSSSLQEQIQTIIQPAEMLSLFFQTEGKALKPSLTILATTAFLQMNDLKQLPIAKNNNTLDRPIALQRAPAYAHQRHEEFLAEYQLDQERLASGKSTTVVT